MMMVVVVRFTFDKKAVFTSQRDGEHFLNATLVNMAPLFISTDPRAGLSPKELDSKALGGEAHHDCMLGVEPITGRTLKMRIPTQLSCSLTDHTSGELDVFYKVCEREGAAGAGGGPPDGGGHRQAD